MRLLHSSAVSGCQAGSISIRLIEVDRQGISDDLRLVAQEDRGHARIAKLLGQRRTRLGRPAGTERVPPLPVRSAQGIQAGRINQGVIEHHGLTGQPVQAWRLAPRVPIGPHPARVQSIDRQADSIHTGDCASVHAQATEPRRHPRPADDAEKATSVRWGRPNRYSNKGTVPFRPLLGLFRILVRLVHGLFPILTMDALAVIVGVAVLVWGLAYSLRGSLIHGCLAFLVVALCFGREFFRFDVGPFFMTLDRVLLAGLVIVYVVQRRLGLTDPKPVSVARRGHAVVGHGAGVQQVQPRLGVGRGGKSGPFGNWSPAS